ncbi:leucyl aminopeptidase, partial [Candidatus Woesearchaeota archaeon]|nr:leucyl aminopeptidase [Candidatus Woesearchaeota archaeon]
RVWKFPFFEEYQDMMDGKISDLNNIETKGKGYEAGAIGGGVFLSKFVKKAKWAHVDIAGPAFLVEDTDYLCRFASGAGVRLLTYWLCDW